MNNFKELYEKKVQFVCFIFFKYYYFFNPFTRGDFYLCIARTDDKKTQSMQQQEQPSSTIGSVKEPVTVIDEKKELKQAFQSKKKQGKETIDPIAEEPKSSDNGTKGPKSLTLEEFKARILGGISGGKKNKDGLEVRFEESENGEEKEGEEEKNKEPPLVGNASFDEKRANAPPAVAPWMDILEEWFPKMLDTFPSIALATANAKMLTMAPEQRQGIVAETLLVIAESRNELITMDTPAPSIDQVLTHLAKKHYAQPMDRMTLTPHELVATLILECIKQSRQVTSKLNELGTQQVQVFEHNNDAVSSQLAQLSIDAKDKESEPTKESLLEGEEVVPSNNDYKKYGPRGVMLYTDQVVSFSDPISTELPIFIAHFPDKTQALKEAKEKNDAKEALDAKDKANVAQEINKANPNGMKKGKGKKPVHKPASGAAQRKQKRERKAAEAKELKEVVEEAKVQARDHLLPILARQVFKYLDGQQRPLVSTALPTDSDSVIFSVGEGESAVKYFEKLGMTCQAPVSIDVVKLYLNSLAKEFNRKHSEVLQTLAIINVYAVQLQCPLMPGSVGMAIYPVLSFMNHNCRDTANVHVTFDIVTGEAKTTAMRTLEPGEELFRLYSQDLAMRPAGSSWNELPIAHRLHCGGPDFHCNCPVCEVIDAKGQVAALEHPIHLLSSINPLLPTGMDFDASDLKTSSILFDTMHPMVTMLLCIRPRIQNAISLQDWRLAGYHIIDLVKIFCQTRTIVFKPQVTDATRNIPEALGGGMGKDGKSIEEAFHPPPINPPINLI